MSNDNVIKLIQPGIFTDHLTEILRNGACALLTQAVEAEVAEFLTKHADLKTGVDFGFNVRTHVKTSCVTQKDLDQDRVIKSDDEGHCSRKVISRSPDKIVFEQTCEAPRASTSTLTIEAKTSESIVYSMDIVQGGAGGKVHVDINGRWLAASCAGINPSYSPHRHALLIFFAT